MLPSATEIKPSEWYFRFSRLRNLKLAVSINKAIIALRMEAASTARRPANFFIRLYYTTSQKRAILKMTFLNESLDTASTSDRKPTDQLCRKQTSLLCIPPTSRSVGPASSVHVFTGMYQVSVDGQRVP
jgi:hypothetical protein